MILTRNFIFTQKMRNDDRTVAFELPSFLHSCLFIFSGMEVYAIKYVGSKNRISKFIVPIIQRCIDDNGITEYYEPFVGGANLIDKIRCDRRFGSDIHHYLIETLKSQSNGWLPPMSISEELYKDIQAHKDRYPADLVGYVGFQLSYGGKWFGGYRRDRIGSRDYSGEAYRNTLNQSARLRDIEFSERDFRDIDIAHLNGAMVYCDIPYKDTTTYTTDKFPYADFYEWARKLSLSNFVLISEYSMPPDFFCVWQKECKTLLDSNKTAGDKSNRRIERLFTHKNGLYFSRYLSFMEN